uniref:Uncharacterized protein n=1 Tax=Rhizophora mucronata TaxID=61149 RepID=A0A2P2NIX3_RHIMU
MTKTTCEGSYMSDNHMFMSSFLLVLVFLEVLL